MAKYKTKIRAIQLHSFKEILSACLYEWDFEQEDKIYKYALMEVLVVLRKKLVDTELKLDYKVTFSETQAQAIYWFWQQLDIQTSDFSNKLHMMALDIHQQYIK